MVVRAVSLVLNPRLLNSIAAVVTAVWTLSMVAHALVPGYQPPAAVHAALMMILGGTFGAKAFRGDNS